MADIGLAKRRVLQGMGPYRTEMERAWGDDFSDLVDYLAVATAPFDDGLERLQRDVRQFPNQRTVVIGDEYSAGIDPTGRDNSILFAAIDAANALAREWKPRALRNFRQEPGSFSVVFSGAVRGVEQFGEFTGSVLMRQFNELTGGAFAPVVFADEMSVNTGDQAWILAALLKVRAADRVVICTPIEHSARFGATVAYAMSKLDVSESCSMFFLAPGTWDEVDEGKGISRAAQAFGPLVQAEGQSKKFGDEYGASRYWKEQNPTLNQGLSCPALSPKEMLKILG